MAQRARHDREVDLLRRAASVAEAALRGEWGAASADEEARAAVVGRHGAAVQAGASRLVEAQKLLSAKEELVLLKRGERQRLREQLAEEEEVLDARLLQTEFPAENVQTMRGWLRWQRSCRMTWRSAWRRT